MNSLEEIYSILAEHKAEIQAAYPVKSLALFGSVVKGTQHPHSDIDILVDFNKPIGLDFVVLADHLEALTGRKVDLVSRNSIKPALMKVIEQNLRYV